MDEQTLLKRLKLSIDRARSDRQSTNSALVSTYLRRDAATGLIQVQTADGGVQYQRKIFDANLGVGDVIPASVRSSNYGFADGKSS